MPLSLWQPSRQPWTQEQDSAGAACFMAFFQLYEKIVLASNAYNIIRQLPAKDIAVDSCTNPTSKSQRLTHSNQCSNTPRSITRSDLPSKSNAIPISSPTSRGSTLYYGARVTNDKPSSWQRSGRHWGNQKSDSSGYKGHSFRIRAAGQQQPVYAWSSLWEEGGPACIQLILSWLWKKIFETFCPHTMYVQSYKASRDCSLCSFVG